MTNPPEHPGGPPQQPEGPWGAPPPGQQPGQQPPQGPPYGPPPGPPPGWQPPGPPPGWQHQPPASSAGPLWQGHQAPQQGYGWPSPPPPRKKRTGLIVGLVVGLLLLLVGGVAAAALLIAADDSDVLAVSELRDNMCLKSTDLAQGNAQVDDLMQTACDGEHDAEVFAQLDLEEGETFEDAGSLCADELDAQQFEDLREDGIEVRPLAEGDPSDEIDSVVCFLRHEDGNPLTEELV